MATRRWAGFGGLSQTWSSVFRQPPWACSRRTDAVTAAIVVGPVFQTVWFPLGRGA